MMETRQQYVEDGRRGSRGEDFAELYLHKTSTNRLTFLDYKNIMY